jgi:hypothetical protein
MILISFAFLIFLSYRHSVQFACSLIFILILDTYGAHMPTITAFILYSLTTFHFCIYHPDGLDIFFVAIKFIIINIIIFNKNIVQHCSYTFIF